MSPAAELHAKNEAIRQAAYASDLRKMSGWPKSLVTESDALLLPQTRFDPAPQFSAFDGRRRRAAVNGGVYAHDGSIVPSAIHLGDPLRYVPDNWAGRPEHVERLAGTWLYAGVLREHFGHFVLESLGRLWGAEGRTDLAGIIYTYFDAELRAGKPSEAGLARRTDGAPNARFIADLIALIGDGLPLRVAGSPLEIERLVIPSQLIGNANVGAAAAGHPDFRAFVRRKLARFDPAPGAPARRLYVSRSRLGPTKVSFLFERVLEEALVDEGYEILYPERLPIAEQIAAYAAAVDIIAPTGSAIHLAAYAMNGRQRVAVIDRQEFAPAKFVRQLELFGAREVIGIGRPWATIASGGGRRSPSHILDLDAIWDDLLQAGLVARPRRFDLLGPAPIDRALDELRQKLGDDDLTVTRAGAGKRSRRSRAAAG